MLNFIRNFLTKNAQITGQCKVGSCEHCEAKFDYELIHNGFNESTYAYCDSCGTTALLSGWEIPENIKIGLHKVITSENENDLKPCECGGKFAANAAPRCPSCVEVLSAEKAAKYIESQAKGTKQGWLWQRNWVGTYCIIIKNKVVRDIWKNP
jgi:hypothetical protein